MNRPDCHPRAPASTQPRARGDCAETQVPPASWGEGIDRSDAALALEVLDGENWFPALGAILDDLPLVVFDFGRDVSAATQWRVPEASMWIFGDSQPLEEPHSGSIS